MLHTYQKKLINLSYNNKQLLLLKLLKEQQIDFTELGYLYDGENSFSLIENFLKGESKQKLCPHLDSFFTEPNTLSYKLEQIYKQDKELQLEQGTQELNLGYLMVEGKFLNNQIVRAPLLFFKVELLKTREDWFLETKGKGVECLTFNKSFLLAYAHYNQQPLREAAFNYDFKDLKFEDGLTFLTALYHLLNHLGLKLNFNTKTFECEVLTFKNETKQTYTANFERGELILHHYAILGLFNQTHAYLIKDYDYLLRQFPQADLENIFFKDRLPQTQVEKIINEVRDQDIYTPFPTDIWQENALKLAKKGASFVVQGPPGSGKSQLICNLILNALVRKQKVLVVCHKTVALDMVYERLKQADYADFITQVADFKQDKTLVFEKLVQSLNYLTLVRSQAPNLELDKPLLQRSFDEYGATIAQIREQLEDFKTAFFDTREFGISVKQLYLSSNPQAPYLDFKPYYQLFKFNQRHQFLNQIETYCYYYARIEATEHIWQERRNFADFDFSDLSQIKYILTNIDLEVSESLLQIEHCIAMKVDLDDITWLKARENEFDNLLNILQADDLFNYLKKYRPIKFFNTAWLHKYKHYFENCFKGVGIERSLDKQDLVYALAVVQKGQRLWANWVYKLWWKLTNKEHQYLHQLLKNNHLPATKDSLKILVERIENRMNFEHYYTQFSAYHWLLNLPQDRDWGSLNKWFETHFKVLEAKSIYENLRNGIRYIELDSLDFEGLKTKIDQLFKWVNILIEKQKYWKTYLTDNQLKRVLKSKTYCQKLLQGLEDFDCLVEYDKFKKGCKDTELEILALIGEHYRGEIKQVKDLFENSLYIAWINHIETKYPILKIVSSGKIEQLEQKLQNSITQRRILAEKLTFLNIYETVQAAVLDNDRLRPHFIDLYQQLKSQKVVSLRTLFDHFTNELLALLPCWLVAPDAVSAIWDLKLLFDVVIFDEASQCSVEKSLPILYRAKQAIIIGDEQQLPPTTIYKTYWQGDETKTAESLLDLGLKYLPQLALLNHFRSKDLALIQFSNRYFYKNKLRILPDYRFLKRSDTAIEYHLIENGIWENQTNRLEAEATVELIQNLVQNRKESIAVITFNSAQSTLIEQLIRTQKIYVPSTVMFKNIENIQGDERDIVIFSIAYAVNAKGKFYSHFGSLNAVKGANRLNVAVTRAREKIYIITSILPSQIQADESSSLGLRYLKDYLYYAWAIHHRTTEIELQADTSLKANWYLRDKIEAHNFKNLKVIKRLPFADLLVEKDEANFLLLTDDDLYYNHFSVLQTHGFRPLFFKQKHWSFKNLYTRNYWQNRTKFWKALDENQSWTLNSD